MWHHGSRLWHTTLLACVCSLSGVALTIVSPADYDTTERRWRSLGRTRSSFVPNPTATTWKTVANDVLDNDTVPIPHSLYHVSIMGYRHHDLISKTLADTGAWDPEEVKAFCKLFQDFGRWGNFLDVGANIGSYTLPMARCLADHGRGGNRVIAIEGQPVTARHVRAGIKYNELKNIHLYEYLLGGTASKDTGLIQEDHWNEGGSAVKDTIDSNSVVLPAPITTLDAILESEGAPMRKIFGMKIDIEGSEMLALEGGQRFFSQGGPCVLLAELQFNESLKQAIEQHGYEQISAPGRFGDTWFRRVDITNCTSRLAA